MNLMPQSFYDSVERAPGLFGRIARFYVEGFREMTVGKKLWAVILIKLAVMFLVFKLFLFPDILKTKYDNDEDRAQAVRTELTDRKP